MQFDGVLLDVRGRPRSDDLAMPAPKPAGNLFSTARAQVALALLAWPSLWEATWRDLAHASGVSLGQAHNALALLTEAGYSRDPARAGKTELLDLWAAAFPTGLATKLTLARYRGQIGPVGDVHSEDPVFVSGESAADDLLRPASLTLYVQELDPRLPVVNKWRSDGPANIVVRRKFWQVPHESDGGLAGVRPAPWPLVYADLVTSDDPQVRTVARQWRTALLDLTNAPEGFLDAVASTSRWLGGPEVRQGSAAPHKSGHTTILGVNHLCAATYSCSAWRTTSAGRMPSRLAMS